MMKTKPFFSVLLVSFVLGFGMASCKKLIEVPPPIDKLENEVVFSDSVLATASVTGIYSRMVTSQSQFGSFLVTTYPGLSADELYNTTTSATYDPFYSNAIPTTSNTIRTGFYEPAYKYIYHTNACLEGLEKATNISAILKEQLIGEMKFMRAFCYFYLTNLFGEVPLITKTDFEINRSIPRGPIESIYQLVIEDLKTATDLLPTGYPTTGKVRPNKWTAAALLSRVYLYREMWDKSEALSSEIINSNQYSLLTNLDNIFTINNLEAIWQLQMSVPTFVQEAQTYIPASATVRPTLAFTPQLLSSFESQDKRRNSWIRTNTVSSVAYNYPFKYRIRSSSTVTANTSENITVFRLAEQYLIRAESRLHLNNLQGAIDDLNVIRKRAGLPNLANSLSYSEIMQTLQNERRIELMTEWGHRWFDLKRWKNADAVLGPIKSGWNSTDILYPIPQSERLLNPSLTQNPGY